MDFEDSAEVFEENLEHVTGKKLNALWEKVNMMSRDQILRVLGGEVHQASGLSTDYLRLTLVSAVKTGRISEAELDAA